MKPRVFPFVIIILAAAVHFPGSAFTFPDAAVPAEASAFTDCGFAYPGPFIHTKARGVGCTTARRVAKQYVYGDRSPLGFVCSPPREISSETLRGHCERGNDRVKIYFGV